VFPNGPRGSLLRRRVVVTFRNAPVQIVCGILLLGALTALACDDDPEGLDPVPLVLTVTPAHQWAGGEVRITVVGAPYEDADVVVAGADTLEIFDRQSFLLGVRLPTGANGPTTLAVLRDGESLGTVITEAYGFEETRIYPVPIGDEITEFPVEWGVAVVSQADGSGDTSEGFSWIHLSAGISRHFPGTSGPNQGKLYRVGVDPVSGDLYFEWDSSLHTVHKGKIIGGELVDLGWVNRPCHRWGCEPLAGDIWVLHEYPLTCRVVTSPDGERCETIHSPGSSEFWGDDPRWIARLWSADIALIEQAALRMSTGEYAYLVTGLKFEFNIAVDEGRGVFYTSNGGYDEESEQAVMLIRTMRGDDGVVIRSVRIETSIDAERADRNGEGMPDLAYDQDRDVLLIHRLETRTLEVRDPVTLELKGEVALRDRPDNWYEAQVVVDPDTDHAFIVYSRGGWRDVGPPPDTPVISIRLPPI
jgi:hypothetical protein